MEMKKSKGPIPFGNRPNNTVQFKVFQGITSEDDLLFVHPYTEDYFCTKPLIALAVYFHRAQIKVHVNKGTYNNSFTKSDIKQFIINSNKIVCLYDKKAKGIIEKYFDHDELIKESLKNCLFVSEILKKFPVFEKEKSRGKKMLKKHYSLMSDGLNHDLSKLLNLQQHGVFKLWKLYEQTDQQDFVNKVIQCLISQVLSLQSLTLAFSIEYLKFQRNSGLRGFITGDLSIDRQDYQILIQQRTQQLEQKKKINFHKLQRYTNLYPSDLTYTSFTELF